MTLRMDDFKDKRNINRHDRQWEAVELHLMIKIIKHFQWIRKDLSVQFSSFAQSCLILCNPMDCSTPRLPVHHQLPEFTQTHAH